MKKFLGVLAIMLVLVMSFAMTASAAALHVDPNPNTTVPFVTPTVDGNIDVAGEGYSNKVDLSDVTCGHYWAHNPMSSQADLYYAFDNEGLYVAGVVTEGLPAVDMAGIDVTGLNQFNYSTGFDDLDIDEETGYNNYGWNGDVMGIMVDPFGAFIAEGFGGGADKSAWYMVGLFEGDNARVYKSQTSTDGEITDKVKAAGKKTAAGWDFEVMIPWDMIIADTDDCSMGFVAVDKETLVKEGTYLRVGAMYHDRFFDEEQGGLGTWGRYIVVPTTLSDGTPGPGGVGENIASYGIELTLGAIDDTDETTTANTTAEPGTTTAPETEIVDVTDASGNKVTDASGNRVTAVVTKKPATTNSQNKGNTTGGNSAQTFDMALAVAIGTFAVSGIGVVASVATKKRK